VETLVSSVTTCRFFGSMSIILRCILNFRRSCVTPTVIQNVLKALGGLEAIEDDLNIIDGYDEVPQEWQEKILTMLREGHVPDEDWKGVSDLDQASAEPSVLTAHSGC
jgi:hypothetical protein